MHLKQAARAYPSISPPTCASVLSSQTHSFSGLPLHPVHNSDTLPASKARGAIPARAVTLVFLSLCRNTPGTNRVRAGPKGRTLRRYHIRPIPLGAILQHPSSSGSPSASRGYFLSVSLLLECVCYGPLVIRGQDSPGQLPVARRRLRPCFQPPAGFRQADHVLPWAVLRATQPSQPPSFP